MYTIPSDLLKWCKPVAYDDIGDKLNYFATSWLLLFFAAMLTTKQYFGSPIQCAVPHEWKSGWEQYAEDYCYVNNTYFIPFDVRIPETKLERKETDIEYYQWVPYFLLAEAFVFYLPNLIWRAYCGVCVKTVLKTAKNLARTYNNEQMENLADLMLTFRGRMMIVFYMLMKCAYICNIAVQFFLFTKFTHFPLLTLCDVPLRKLGQKEVVTLQCVLMINAINEKVFAFLWYWLVFIAVTTTVNLVYWLATIRAIDDATLILRFIASYAGDMIATKLCTLLAERECIKGPLNA